MKMHGDWVFSITVMYMVMAAMVLWQLQEGMDPVAAIGIGIGAGVFVGIVIVLSLPKWERMRAKQLEELKRGFPWRRFASGNGFAAAIVAMLAAGGSSRGTLEFDAALIFGIGNAAMVVQWLMQRRAARQALGNPDDSARRTPTST
jgi:hypothetical protein